jgi:hypothetical protein
MMPSLTRLNVMIAEKVMSIEMGSLGENGKKYKIVTRRK